MPFRFDHVPFLKILHDPDSEQRAIDQVIALVYAVHTTHSGRPLAEVEVELRRQFVAHGFTPEEPAFSEVVRAIAQSEPSE